MVSWEEKKEIILEGIERVTRYTWSGHRQSREFNNLGNFVYTTYDYDELIRKADKKIREKNLDPFFKQYTINRYYNYMTTLIIESFFGEHPSIRARKNRRDRFVDFLIANTRFDLKVTFPPKDFSMDRIRSLFENPLPLATWFYKNQSVTRFHAEPRLFLTLVDIDGGNEEETRWVMKKEFGKIKKAVDFYLRDIENREFPSVSFRYDQRDHATKTDIFFIVKESNEYSVICYKWRDNIPTPERIRI